MNTLRVAAVQCDLLWQQSSANLNSALEAIASADADLVVLPEMFATGFSMDSRKIAQQGDGQIVSSLRAAAQSEGKAIIFSAAIIEDGLVYNRLFAITPQGDTHTYDKRHLFRMSGEHNHYAAGERSLIFSYKGFRISPLVCYDLRFPVFSRGADRYDLLIYIASWPSSRIYAWDTLLPARAIENQSYVVGVNRIGSDPNNQYSGHSVIVDYLGQPIVCAQPYCQQTIVGDLSLDDLRAFRLSLPAHLDADNFTLNL